jgi:hypothetical protein
MLPFNHFYLALGTLKNSIAAEMFLEYWDGSQFRDVANKLDETMALFENNFVSWTPDKDYSWQPQDSTEIEEIKTVSYYDLYWERVTFSTTLTPGLFLKYIGQRFCTDDELYVEFPQFSEFKWQNGYEADKTDWIAQSIAASDLIANSLRTSDKLQTRDQILDRVGLRDCTIQKTAEIIYNRFGQGRVEEKQEARTEAAIRLKNAFPKIDKDANARYEQKELNKTVRWTR